MLAVFLPPELQVKSYKMWHSKIIKLFKSLIYTKLYWKYIYNKNILFLSLLHSNKILILLF